MLNDQSNYWQGRLLQETEAALLARDARIAALHVELANRYALLLTDRHSPRIPA
jgi:hypothetical protein